MLHFLIADSETPDEREARRDSAGKSAGETYAATLRQLHPGVEITIISPADGDAPVLTTAAVRAFDAVFLSGSPLHVYDDTPEVRRQLEFMRTVYAAGTPSFGSCAGLQAAAAAAGGTVRKMPRRMEAGIARRITATAAGRDHPLLAGRPPSWDAPAIHGDEVETLPPGGMILARNAAAQIQAVEIRHDRGVFWGVQYHPELALGEIAVALRRQAESLVDAGLATTTSDVDIHADRLDQLHRDPDHQSARWLLGIDDELADEGRRRTEIRNFIAHLPLLDPDKAEDLAAAA
ncbi:MULTISPECIES: gamma-glutamyl-gamma-aminobutyrate hydrolase family protein [unclassified Sphingomonas]|uniref:glutamine amidotransferase-related protein n=2 Tax=Sphingomonas TaxID=13687 RepID=UPI002269A86A|nr:MULTISPECIES: gamma-glutamyl-gamma-aminobutyrate hydrolase family protein [unclassified Sphingomonas]